ncbi:hypothetical protein HOE91_05405 [archaeon]|nr:hypothetical protein [archaeon]
MNFEKRIVIAFSIILVLIVGLSFLDGFTGFVVNSYGGAVEYQDTLPGNTIKGDLLVNVEGEGIIKEVVDVTGEVADWVILEDTNYIFVPNVDNKIPYKIVVPEDVEPGTYKLRFSVRSVQDFEKESILSNQVVSSLDVLISIGEEEENRFTIKEFEVYDFEETNQLDFLLEIENKGNNEEDLEISVILTDLEGNYLTEKRFSGKMYAFETQEIKYGFAPELEAGDYIAEAYVQVGDLRKKETSFFKVYKDGQMIKKASILGTGIYVKNEEVFVTTIVKNTGESVLELSLTGTIEGRETQTSTERIHPGDYETFEYQYGAFEAGDYLLTTEILAHSVVLGDQLTNLYVSDEGVVTLEIGFIGILILIIISLISSHFLLKKRLKK